MTESSLQRRIRLALEVRGAWVIKTHGSVFGNKGCPDLVACYAGRFVALEVKEPGKRPSPMQRVHLERIRAAGGVGAVVETVEQALEALQ